MSNPGNKRLQRAKHGAAPSSDGTLATTHIGAGRGRGDVQRTKGSVVNNAGNMMQGLFPTVGKSLPFLLKLEYCCRPGRVPQSGVVTNN